MAKNTRNTKGRIISAAWELFYEQGYEDTTVEEIIERSATSKGSFYHYLLARLLSSQLITKGDKHLLDRDRLYFKYLRQIVVEGQQKGQLKTERTVNEIVKLYALTERALMYDWCLCGGEYSLTAYAEKMMPMFLGGLRPEK